MSQEPKDSKPTERQIFDAVRNEYDATFVLGDLAKGGREFPVRDLSYNDYCEFVKLARPIISAVTAGIDLKSGGNEQGEVDIQFNPFSLDYDALIDLAKDDLPRMAWLCVRQSDSKIKIEDVKKIGRRPQAMLAVVLAQIKHNELVTEFASFFGQLVPLLRDLMPEVQQIAPTPIQPTASTTEEIPA